MTQWHDVAAQDDVFDGAGLAVQVAGHDIAVFQVDGAFFAVDNTCSHGDARLCEGFVEGHEVECPFHQGRFDLRTGQATCAPATEPIRIWPVKPEGGRIWVNLSDGPSQP
ncbi:MAG: non-heme iron oxygenase ferredoxin subunit [Betaproteobacteria bacterium]|jgi:naphthalene 1,2-dioxygenase ferredoxin component|nr:non-heme iron oxygenase ferredoxin subunit [Betaproteobacteria bacterium]